MSSQDHPLKQMCIGEEFPCYVIAEVGSNHNQDLSLAKELIAMAAEAGADAVKFQSIQYDQIHFKNHEPESVARWFKKIELEESWYRVLSEICKKNGVDFLSAPTYSGAITLLENEQVKAYKIASPQAQANLQLVEQVAKLGKPMFVSTGYCEYSDIARTLNVCRLVGNTNLVFLHCISKYPALPKDTNLSFMKTLGNMTGCLVGFSDHSAGTHIPLAAVALGAKVLEKHITLDKSMNGPDHHFALQIEDFKVLVSQIKELESALGTGSRTTLLEEEYQLREMVALKAFTGKSFKKGEVIAPDDLIWRRYSGEGIREHEVMALGTVFARKDISIKTPLTREDIMLHPSDMRLT